MLLFVIDVRHRLNLIKIRGNDRRALLRAYVTRSTFFASSMIYSQSNTLLLPYYVRFMTYKYKKSFFLTCCFYFLSVIHIHQGALKRIACTLLVIFIFFARWRLAKMKWKWQERRNQRISLVLFLVGFKVYLTAKELFINDVWIMNYNVRINGSKLICKASKVSFRC